MSTLVSSLLVALFGYGGASSPTVLDAILPDSITAFVNVTVVPMDTERLLPDHTVVVQDGRIVAVGPSRSVRVPRGARRVDARGKFLMPGLSEMHAHIPGGNAPPGEQERVLQLYVANGVTIIRGMLGHPSHLLLRDRAARDELVSPTILAAGPSFNGNSVTSWDVGVRMVEEQKAAGYDLLKIHPGIARANFDSIVAAARRAGIRFAGHVPLDVGLDRALAAPYWSIDHLDGYVEAMAHKDGATQAASQFFGANLAREADRSRIPDLVRRTRAAGVWNVPTQVLFEHMATPETPEQMAARPELIYVSAAAVSQWMQAKQNIPQQLGGPAVMAELLQVRRALLRALQEGGAGLLLGADSPQWWNVPGFASHRELAALVAAGLTPYQALRAGTANVAAFLGQEKVFGTVAQGMRADLILLDANPLADVGAASRPAGVMVRGRWLDRSALDEMLAGVARAYAR